MSRNNDRLAAERRVAINRFADALADGLSMHDAAKRIGCSVSAGRNYLIEIRRKLGPQAV